MSEEKQEFDDLAELPELQELPELPDLPEVAELAEIPEIEEIPGPKASATTATAAASPKPASTSQEPTPRKSKAPAKPEARSPVELPPLELEPEEVEPEVVKPTTASGSATLIEESPAPGAPAQLAAPLADGAIPPLRQLDKAPTHLRLAAQIVAVGSLLPFMGLGDGGADGVWFSLGAKIIVLGAAWLWLQQHLHDFGPKATGVVGHLANLRLLKKKKKEDGEDQPKRRASEKGLAKLEHPFPTGLHALSVIVFGAGVFLSLSDARSSMFGPLGTAETLMFAWAAATWVHIAGYERWCGFSPLFPLMFLGMFFAGSAQVVGAVTAGDAIPGLWRLFSGLGGGIVTAGGGLAAFTIVEAMMEAKKEGDRKKAEALEARKAARKSRKK